MNKRSLCGFNFKIDDGKIIAIGQCDKEIFVGGYVENMTSSYGVKENAVGKVIAIGFPYMDKLTTNIIFIDFDGDDVPDAHLKLEDIIPAMELISQPLNQNLPLIG